MTWATAWKFLSTPSARRATVLRVAGSAVHQNFYPRPPRGGRPQSMLEGISPVLFLSTPSARRATPCTTNHRSLCVISIHALREEGDMTGRLVDMSFSLFLSTPSARRATPSIAKSGNQRQNFYPRPPRGGRHKKRPKHRAPGRISIHALREEGDLRDRRQRE